MAMCKFPCENVNAEQALLNKMKEVHEGHYPVQRDYSHNKKTHKTHLVILILTAVDHRGARDTIRKTWFSQLYPNVTLWFCIGTSGLSQSSSRDLQAENTAHSDLLLLPNIRESYQGLTVKLLESFKWLNQKVDFQYVIKADDDTFIRVDKILADLQTKPLERLYWGFFDGRANIKKTGQWAENKWILCDKYLPHARGGGYVLSADLINYIASNANMLQVFNSEDISVGTWLGPLNIDRIHDPRFDTEYVSRGCNNDYIITHKQREEDMEEKWNNLKVNGQLCSKELKLKLSYVYNWKAFPSQCCIRNDSSVP